MSLLHPDRYFDRVSSINIERDLLLPGFDNVLLDVDNTVRSRADNCIPRDVREWVVRAKDANINLALFSNSWHDLTLEYGKELDLPVIMRSVKPLPFGTLRALHVLNEKKECCGERAVAKVSRANTVVVGDQVFTDVLSAHLIGMTAYLVVPLSNVNIKSASWQRVLETRVLTGQVPEPALSKRMQER